MPEKSLLKKIDKVAARNAIILVFLFFITITLVWTIYISKIDPTSDWYSLRDTIIAIFVGMDVFMITVIVVLMEKQKREHFQEIVQFELKLKDAENERLKVVIKNLEQRIREIKIN